MFLNGVSPSGGVGFFQGLFLSHPQPGSLEQIVA
jgi:hypothetical protein